MHSTWCTGCSTRQREGPEGSSHWSSGVPFGLTGNLGNAWRNPESETIATDSALDAFLFTYQHDDGSDRTAYVQVLGAIEGDLLYVISFRSNTRPVDNRLLEYLFLAVRDGTA